jgi:hypothetical protein
MLLVEEEGRVGQDRICEMDRYRMVEATILGVA